MAELNESKMNFAALKRVDPYAKSLLETAAHVALYTFINNDWKKTDIEGALFVYSRTGEPFHNILIMNRLNMKNLMEPVTQGMELQLQDPFLLYRTPQSLIYGIWFYDKEECVKIANSLIKIIKVTGENHTDKRGKPSTDLFGKNVDIFSMLTKAQEEYNSKSPQKNRPEVLSLRNPLDLNYNVQEPGHTPQSVMDFFAKASTNNGPKFIQDPSVIQQSSIFSNGPPAGPPPGLPPMQSLPIAIPATQNDVKPFLQRLMSNPAHSVEHIEKQQRAITPHNDLTSLMRNGSTSLSTSNGKETLQNLPFNVNLKPDHDDFIKPAGKGAAQNQIENGLGFLRISDSSPVTVQSQQFFNSKLTRNCSPLNAEGTPDGINVSLGQSEAHRPLSAPMDSLAKPALMPPVMFTSSVIKEEKPDMLFKAPVASLTSNSNQGNLSNCFRPEPLTKNQLLQAMDYLMKHDPEFMNKVHEAYLKSFSELCS